MPWRAWGMVVCMTWRLAKGISCVVISKTPSIQKQQLLIHPTRCSSQRWMKRAFIQSKRFYENSMQILRWMNSVTRFDEIRDDSMDSSKACSIVYLCINVDWRLINSVRCCGRKGGRRGGFFGYISKIMSSSARVSSKQPDEMRYNSLCRRVFGGRRVLEDMKCLEERRSEAWERDEVKLVWETKWSCSPKYRKSVPFHRWVGWQRCALLRACDRKHIQVATTI